MTIFLVDHDMGLVLNICDYIYVIEFGRKIAEGTPAAGEARPARHRRLPRCGGGRRDGRRGAGRRAPPGEAQTGAGGAEVVDT